MYSSYVMFVSEFRVSEKTIKKNKKNKFQKKQ